MTDAVSRAVSMQELGPIIARTVKSGGTAEMTVTGSSMMPLLLDRVSRVKLVAVSEPMLGDIVLYRRDNGSYVLHRIVAYAPDGTYTMCGDGQTQTEPGLRREQMIASVASFARRKKWRNVDVALHNIWWHVRIADRPLRRFIQRGIGFVKRKLIHPHN